MDVETCETRLIQAAWTLQCLPDPDQKYRSSYKSAWPEYVLEYGGIKKRKIPTPGEISEYEEALGWIRHIPLVREQKFMFQAFLSQRGEKKFRIQWPVVRKKSGLGGSNYHCRQLYRSWLQMMATKTI